MSDKVYIVLDYLKDKVDTAIVHLANRNEFQVKYSENQIDTTKTWNFEEIDFFIEKEKKTIGSSMPIPDTDDELKKDHEAVLPEGQHIDKDGKLAPCSLQEASLFYLVCVLFTENQ